VREFDGNTTAANALWEAAKQGIPAEASTAGHRRFFQSGYRMMPDRPHLALYDSFSVALGFCLIRPTLLCPNLLAGLQDVTCVSPPPCSVRFCQRGSRILPLYLPNLAMYDFFSGAPGFCLHRIYRLRLVRSNSFSVAPGLSLQHSTRQHLVLEQCITEYPTA
jgi:hypothetical protein